MRGYRAPDWWHEGTRLVFACTVDRHVPYVEWELWRKWLLAFWCNWVTKALVRLGAISAL